MRLLLRAVAVSVLVSGLVGFLTMKVEWLPTAMFGLALGFIGMSFLRSIIITVAPVVLEQWMIDYYWLLTAIVSLIVATSSCLCVTSDGRKSLVILATSSAVGAYGVTVAVSALVNLYVREGAFESWAMIAFFMCVALTGFLFQTFLSGNAAATSGNEEAIKHLQAEPPRRGEDAPPQGKV